MANGWQGLLDIYREQRDIEASPPVRVACPNDGEPLLMGPDGTLHCRYDGWTPSGPDDLIE